MPDRSLKELFQQSDDNDYTFVSWKKHPVVELQSISCYITYLTIRYSIVSQMYSWRRLCGDLGFEKSHMVNRGIICNSSLCGLRNCGTLQWISNLPPWVNLSKLSFLIHTVEMMFLTLFNLQALFERWRRECHLTSFLEKAAYCFLQITWNSLCVIMLNPLKYSQSNNRSFMDHI